MNKPQVMKTPADWAERAADLVATVNRDPEHQIGYYGDDPKEIRHFLLEETPEVVERSAVAIQDGEVVGFLGAECDAEVGRSWLFGPTVTDADRDGVADALFEILEPLLPKDAPELELFFNDKNETVLTFGVRHGFGRSKDSEILRFRRVSLAGLPPGDARPVGDAELDEVIALHDLSFPSAPWTGRQVMERRSEHESVLVLAGSAGVTGYIHTRVNPTFPEGNIEFLAVAEGERGEGAGTRLVASALRWMFSFPHIEETWLVVMEDNPGARGLYLNLGFEPVHKMRSMRKNTG